MRPKVQQLSRTVVQHVVQGRPKVFSQHVRIQTKRKPKKSQTWFKNLQLVHKFVKYAIATKKFTSLCITKQIASGIPGSHGKLTSQTFPWHLMRNDVHAQYLVLHVMQSQFGVMNHSVMSTSEPVITDRAVVLSLTLANNKTIPWNTHTSTHASNHGEKTQLCGFYWLFRVLNPVFEKTTWRVLDIHVF